MKPLKGFKSKTLQIVYIETLPKVTDENYRRKYQI